MIRLRRQAASMRSMRWASVVCAFLVGALVSPAWGQSYPGDYVKIFGHSTSCALGAASINNTTYKSGARTSNYRGCSENNATRSVPVGYLGARAIMRDYYTGAICGASSVKWNTSVTWTTVTTQPWTNATGCSKPGYYYGQNQVYRDTDNDGLKTRSDIFSPVVYLSIWDT